MSDIDPRDFGRLEAEVSALTEMVKAQSVAIAALTELVAQSRGGVRTILWLGGAAAAFGGFVSWVIQHVKLQ